MYRCTTAELTWRPGAPGNNVGQPEGHRAPGQWQALHQSRSMADVRGCDPALPARPGLSATGCCVGHSHSQWFAKSSRFDESWGKATGEVRGGNKREMELDATANIASLLVDSYRNCQYENIERNCAQLQSLFCWFMSLYSTHRALKRFCLIATPASRDSLIIVRFKNIFDYLLTNWLTSLHVLGFARQPIGCKWRSFSQKISFGIDIAHVSSSIPLSRISNYRPNEVNSSK